MPTSLLAKRVSTELPLIAENLVCVCRSLTPLFCGIDNSLSDVTNLDGGVHLESPTTQFARNSLHQLVGWFLLVVQLGSVAWSHLRGSRRTGLQHMQDPNFYMLRAKLRDNSL